VRSGASEPTIAIKPPGATTGREAVAPKSPSPTIGVSDRASDTTRESSTPTAEPSARKAAARSRVEAGAAPRLEAGRGVGLEAGERPQRSERGRSGPRRPVGVPLLPNASVLYVQRHNASTL
jgi:hypothetical protein